MTKSVRIENGDTSDFKIKVTVQIKNQMGDWIDEKVGNLDFPAQQVTETLWQGKRIIIEEDGVSDYKFMRKDGK